MDLNALYQYLLSMVSPIVLRSTDVSLQAPFQAFIATMPGKQITIVPASGSITLVNNLLSISGTTIDQWPVQGLTNVIVPLSSVILTIDGSTSVSVFTGVAQGQMPFSVSVTIPVVVTALNQDGSPWQITLAQNATGITPMQVMLLGNNGSGFPFDIPSGMDFLSAALTVNQNAYSITFYPNTTNESVTQFMLSVTSAVWAPVPGIFAFNGVDIIALIKTNSFGVTLVGHLLISNVGVDAGISMTMGSNWSVFTRPTPPAIAFPGLAALANWIGGTTLGTEVSTGFSSVQISTNGFDAAITDVTASINVSNFTLNFLNISSLLSIGAMQLDVTLQLPSLYIKGGLHDGQGMKITELLTSFSLPADTVPSDLTLAKANFTADLSNSIYSIDLELDNLWTAGPLSFEQVTLALGYESTQGITGSFGCTFSIGDTATILLNAEYEGAEAGWTFSGGLDPNTTLNMGEVTALLLNQFGIDSVPEPVNSLVITALWVEYAAATSAFSFTCSGNFTVDDVLVQMSVIVKLQTGQGSGTPAEGQINGTKGYNAFFSGTITLNDMVFTIVFNTSATLVNVFIATYQNTATINTPLRSLVASVSTALSQVIPPSLIITIKEVKFVFYEEKSIKQFAFGLELGASLNLSDLPVIGPKLPEGLTVNIDNLQVLYASTVFIGTQITVINNLLPDGVLKLNATGLAKGLLIAGDLMIAGYKLPLNTGTNPPPPAITSFTGKAALPAGATSVAPSPVTWFNVNKQLGPMKFQRIGVAFEDNVLSFALDATLTLGPATLTMEGLSMGSPLSAFVPQFGLQGFAMDISTAGFEIGGAFLKAKAPDGATAYYGEVVVKIGTFSIMALGGDTPAHEADDPNNPGQKIHIPASFFIYANITAPLGGPPFLYVNGFAGGFGVNNSLKLPTLENLPGYILLPGAGSKAPKQGATPSDTIAIVLPQMQLYFISQPGQYWVAAGIAFSSFQMINAFALVTVSFGVDFQVALIGSCSMNFPTGAPQPIAYIEIDIMASFSPATGLLAVEGILSPASYVFGSFCQITGGFAFYIWFNPPVMENGPKSGDFVVTIGGYHPAFNPPAYYPKVPRLGINFNLGPFHVTGGCYFALTPGMFMAGGSLKAVWDLDVVKAWFTIGADFLIAWAPFHYEADVYVSIGCSIDLGLFTLNISVGADLSLWGPPFGGRAEVDLDVVTFIIIFGAEQHAPEPIGWQNFKTMFLPADGSGSSKQPAPHLMLAMAATASAPQVVSSNTTNILKSTIPVGMDGAGVTGFDWILNPDHFIILINTVIPVNTPQWTTSSTTVQAISNNLADYNASPPPINPQAWPYLVFSTTNNFSNDQVWNTTVNIKPMNLNEVSSLLTISVMKMNNQGAYDSYVTALTIEPVLLDSSAALWAPASGEKPKANDPAFQQACLTGFRISPLPRVPNVINGILLIQLLYQQGNNYNFIYQQQVVETDYTVNSAITESNDTSILTITISGHYGATLPNQDYVLSSLADNWVAAQRSAILANLNTIGFSTYLQANLTTFASQTALTDWPGVALLSTPL